jgi:hypothetical protein
MRRRFALVVAFSVALPLCLASCGGSSLGAPPIPGGGEVAGRLVSQKSDGSERAPEPGLPIGAFTEALPPGPPVQNPPQPVATATTTDEGLFLLSGLEPGKYFITTVQPGPVTQGVWAPVTANQGASVVLVVCTDCPVPLQGSSGA